ncbi:hypothetical protein AAG906_011812 [Vitis piasezkii]
MTFSSLDLYPFSAMGAPLLLLLSTSSRQSLIKPLSAYLHIPIKRYSRSSSSEHGLGERAPSTAEEFQRVAAEKRELQGLVEEKARKGVVSQTSDKALEAAQVAVLEDSNLETVKEKDPKRKGD